jgi:hypothetical protein
MKQKEFLEDLDRAGITNKAGRPLVRPVQDREWLKPIVSLVGNQLVYSFAPDMQVYDMAETLSPPQPLSSTSASIVYPKEDLLEAFLKFAEKNATSEQILDFARQYGVLELCEHHLPRTHSDIFITISASTVRAGCRPLSCPGKPAYAQEPIRGWKALAHRFRAILQIAALLHQDKPAPLRAWKAITSMGAGTGRKDWLALHEYEAKPASERLGIHRALFNRVINWLLQMANVRPWFWWSKDGNGIEFGGVGLFGHLVLQLVLAVSRKDGFTFCTVCSQAYLITRRPARNRRNYCSKCRADGAPQRHAAMRYWRKTGSRKRKNKLSRKVS